MQPIARPLAGPVEALPAAPAPTSALPTHGRQRRRTLVLALALADATTLVTAFALSGWVVGSEGVESSRFAERELLFVLTLPVWLAGLKASGLYDRDLAVIGHSTLDELAKLLQVSTTGAWGLALLLWAFSGGPRFGALVAFWAGASLGLPALRALVRAGFHRRAVLHQRVVIVGAGGVSRLLAHKLVRHPEYRVVLLGLVVDEPGERPDAYGLPVLGERSDLPRLVEELAVDRVVIADSTDTDEALDSIRVLRDRSVRIDLVPQAFRAIPPRLVSSTIEGIPLVTLQPARRSRVQKRAFDLVVASVALVLLAPILVLIAFLVKLDSPGPVIVRQVRIGEGERRFTMFKFRTMVADAEARKLEVAHLNTHLAPGGDSRMFKIKQDPRVTRAGRVLRRHSLDELPQLVNVVTGTMSLIGPRPLIPEEDRHVEGWGRKRLLVKPGMTGLWQVLGRHAVPFEEMVNLDYLYVTSWSFANDCRLLARTVPLVLRGSSDDC